jgi:tetratricopeptide (TPR) repeat protein
MFCSRLPEAETLLRDVSHRLCSALGEEHPFSLESLHNLAQVLCQKGDLSEAESLLRKVIEGRSKKLGAENPCTLVSMHQLAEVLLKKGRFKEGENLIKKALESQERYLGEDHPDTLIMMDSLARICMAQEELSKALDLFKSVVEEAENSLPPEHLDIAWFRINYGECLMKHGLFQEAEVQLLEGYKSVKAALGERNARIQAPLEVIIDLYNAWDKPTELAAFHALLSSR